jgi:shikimate kinase
MREMNSTLMKNIILIGAPNRGKSTLGKLAAERFGMRYLDIDEMAMGYAIERGNPVYIFTNMLRYQSKAVREALECDEPVIISAGASIIESPDDLELLRDSGFVIHIKRRSDLSVMPPSRFALVHTSMGGDGEKVEKISAGAELSDMLNKEYERDMQQYEEAADAVLDNDGTVEEGLEKLAVLIEQVGRRGHGAVHNG